jgi:sugar phosphate isomerase/epimerase
MPQININIAYQRLSADSFEFLDCQNLHPEFYFAGHDIDKLEKEEIGSFKDEVEQRNFVPTLHAPFFDLNVGARDSLICKVSLERLIWALEVARLLNAKTVVVHPGYGPWILGHRFAAWLKRAKRYLDILVNHAAALDIKIAFENIYDAGPEDLKMLIDQFDNNRVGICLDIGHYNVFKKEPLPNWLNVLGPHIFEVHLHDNDGSADQHLALGDGNINYSELKQWYNSISVETRPVLTLELPHRTHVVKSVNTLKSWFT